MGGSISDLDSVRFPRGFRRFAGALVGIVIASAAIAAPASAEVLDANCPGPDNFGTGTFDNSGIAQTFIAQNTGALVRAEVLINHADTQSNDYELRIVTTDGTGAPTDTVLASATIEGSTVPMGEQMLVGAFASPPNVQAGERYAVVITRSLAFTVRERVNGDPCPNSEEFSSATASSPWGPLPGSDLVFSIFVEPTAVPPPPADGVADLAPPDTSITKGPNDKTNKKTATFEFTGTDARAIASFQCKLDSGAFAPCTSPFTVKVKKGKHTFQVQARDQAGNLDATPATDSWKVKKKRKK